MLSISATSCHPHLVLAGSTPVVHTFWAQQCHSSAVPMSGLNTACAGLLDPVISWYLRALEQLTVSGDL